MSLFLYLCKIEILLLTDVEDFSFVSVFTEIRPQYEAQADLELALPV